MQTRGRRLARAVGGSKWEPLAHAIRPERGLLGIGSELNLFSNLRPAVLYPQLVDASTLKPEIVSGLDIMIVRELTGGIYFGQPRGIDTVESGEKIGINTKIYRESEIRRIAHSAFKIAQKRHILHTVTIAENEIIGIAVIRRVRH